MKTPQPSSSEKLTETRMKGADWPAFLLADSRRAGPRCQAAVGLPDYRPARAPSGARPLTGLFISSMGTQPRVDLTNSRPRRGEASGSIKARFERCARWSAVRLRPRRPPAGKALASRGPTANRRLSIALRSLARSSPRLRSVRRLLRPMGSHPSRIGFAFKTAGGRRSSLRERPAGTRSTACSRRRPRRGR